MSFFETAEEKFNRLSREKGWFEMTELELLAADVIADLQTEAAQALSDAESERDDAESERDEYENQVCRLEDDLRELREEQAPDETTQDDEVEFLKGLVSDLEDELAAIDAASAA